MDKIGEMVNRVTALLEECVSEEYRNNSPDPKRLKDICSVLKELSSLQPPEDNNITVTFVGGEESWRQ